MPQLIQPGDTWASGNNPSSNAGSQNFSRAQLAYGGSPLGTWTNGPYDLPPNDGQMGIDLFTAFTTPPMASSVTLVQNLATFANGFYNAVLYSIGSTAGTNAFIIPLGGAHVDITPAAGFTGGGAINLFSFDSIALLGRVSFQFGFNIPITLGAIPYFVHVRMAITRIR